jgi:DinB superfamily
MSTRSHESSNTSTMSNPAAISRRSALKAGAAGLAAVLSFGHITPAMAEELARLSQGKPMTGARLAEILRTERVQWNALLAQVGPERMEIPGAAGDWSVKQLVAHLTWYEGAIVEGAEHALSTGTFKRRRPEGVSMDENNERIASESQYRPVTEVLAEADSVFGRLLPLIEACPENLLNDPGILGLPEDMVPWMGVANNSYAHYREHELDLRAWLARQ